MKLFFFILFMASFSYATDDEKIVQASNQKCTTIRLDEKDGSMEHVPAMRQTIGSCYVHAAAQMYDALRFMNGDTRYDVLTARMTSASDYQRQWGGYTLNTGYADGVLKDIQARKGSCPMIAQTETLTGLKENSEIFVKDFTDSLTNIRNYYYEAKKAFNGKKIENRAGDRLNKALGICAQNSGVALTNTPDLVHYLKKGRLIEILEQTITISCEEKDRLRIEKDWGYESTLKNPEFVGDHFSASQVSTLDKIHAQLDKGKTTLPMAVDYCSQIFAGEPNQSLKKKGPPDKECGAHSSLVIGRKKGADGRCLFLVRNSWGNQPAGKDPEGHKKAWDVEKDSGNVWVDAEVLVKNSFGLTTIFTK